MTSAPRPGIAGLHGDPPGPLLLWGVAVAGLGAAAGSAALAVASDDLPRPALQAVLINWIVLPYILSGIVAWWRRPDSRLGPLMVTVGFVTAVSALQWAEAVVPHTLGQLVDLLPPVLILHCFLAYPSGRLRTRVERGVVVAGYACAVALQVVKLTLGSDPTSALTTVPEPALAALVEQLQLLSVSALLLLGVLLLVLRRRREGRPSRRPAVLLTDAFGLGLIMLALLFVAGLDQWSTVVTIRHVTYAVLGLVPVAFLAGLLDARLARGDAGVRLVEMLGDPVPDLRAPLAQALHDPSVQVAYWLPEFDSWADQDGQPTTLPAEGEARVARVIRREGVPVAALVVDRSLQEERELLDAVAAAAGLALENGRLNVELRARLAELQGSRTRLLEAGQSERRRLERDLHDGAQQRLVALSLELGMLEDSLGTDSAAQVRLARARSEVAASLAELRDVARGLYPAVLSGHGLAVALESLAARSVVPVHLAVDVVGRLPEPVEIAAYYVVCESLANVGKHAQAGSADVAVTRADGWMTVRVADDGIGGADTERGSGLRGLADRVEALGGRLRIWSPPGGGTRLEARVPCG